MITITPIAHKKILEFIKNTDKPIKGLHVTAEVISPLKVNYRLSLILEGQERSEDIMINAEGFNVYIDARSADHLKGATLDYIEDMMNSGFKIDSPKKLTPQLMGPVAARIQELIDQRINPAISNHGGWVNLVDIKDTIVYVQLGGGCQGCGMVDVTLKQGIEVMIKEAVPEITQVLDVTDHAGGRNPYYQPSK
jgi:Fe/S biogenesis protein NfuA